MKRFNPILAVSVLFIFLLINACYYDQSIVQEITPDPGVEVTFTGDIQPIFNASCNSAGCHNTGGIAPDLSSGKAYNALTNGGFINVANPQSSELYQWMKGNRALPMPLSGADANYNAKVLSWITQGALNN